MFGYAANYYLPTQQDYSATQQVYSATQHNDNETQPPAKKQCQSVSTPPRAARILGRKYALTATSFKYVEIAISVGLMSTVEIILGDNRGTQLRLPHATWKAMVEKRDDIQQLLKESSRSPLRIQDLSVQVCTFNGSKVFKLSLSSNYLYLMPATLNYLFNLEHCIEHMYTWLVENTRLVDIKVQNFVNVLREKNITKICDATKAIRESEIFDSESLVDCELLACAIYDIMYITIN